MESYKIFYSWVIKVLCLVVLIVGGSACQKKIDASNAKTFMTSSKAMQQSLPKEKQAEFEKAIRAIAFTHIDVGYLNDKNTGKSFSVELQKKLDGLTYDQVLKMGKEILEKARVDALKDVRPQVDKLLKEKANAEKQATILKAIDIQEAKFTYDKPDDAELYSLGYSYKIVNNSTITLRKISRVNVKIMNPNSTKPWYEVSRISSNINLIIDKRQGDDYEEGLKPGQAIVFTTGGIVSSAFNADNQPDKNATLQVKLLEIEDIAGKKYTAFDSRRQKQLEDFLKNYPELAK
ncbi:hypothetical protein BKI52_31305 [marine bacterium AO1-C]|nr:hypothetical protein BKI52_31305 [marine bacterium AO1-C]